MKKRIVETSIILLWATQASAAWNISTLDSTGDVGKYAAISIAYCAYHASYYDSTNGNLKFVNISIPWQSSDAICVDTTGNVGKFTSISAWLESWSPRRENILISYYDVTNGNLKCAWKKDWISDTFELSTIDSVGNVGLFTSLYVDTICKRPYISYYDANNKDLKLAYYNDTNWIIQTIDTTGDVGQYNSIWGFIDTIYISYYDATNGDLKLAKYSNPVVQIEKIDTIGNVGQHTSINNFRISYYDVDKGDLKIADWYQNKWHINKLDTLDNVGLFSNISKDIIYSIYYYDKTNGTLKNSYGEIIDSVNNVGGYCANADGVEISLVIYYDFTNGDLKKAWVGGAVEETQKEQLVSVKVMPTILHKNISISYSLPCPSYVNLKVFSLTGNLVDNLVDENQKAGSHNILWKPYNLPNGTYFLQIKINNCIDNKKIVLIK